MSKTDRNEIEELFTGEVFEPEPIEEEPVEDALGQDVFQALLEVAYARYMLNSTRNLIDHVYGTGPSFVPRKGRKQP